MIRNICPSIVMMLVMMIVLAALYPAAVMVTGQTAFPFEAKGSIVSTDGHVLGSELIGYPSNSGEGYFQLRPSKASVDDSKILTSGASNLMLNNKDLIKEVDERYESWQKIAGQKPVPTEMIFASASGLDPNISVEAAELQARAIAQHRNIDTKEVQQLISANRTQVKFLHLNMVNAVKLNFLLDQKYPMTHDAE